MDFPRVRPLSDAVTLSNSLLSWLRRQHIGVPDDEVDAAAYVSCKMYAPTEGSGYVWSVYDAVRHIRAEPTWQRRIVPIDQFVAALPPDLGASRALTSSCFRRCPWQGSGGCRWSIVSALRFIARLMVTVSRSFSTRALVETRRCGSRLDTSKACMGSSASD